MAIWDRQEPQEMQGSSAKEAVEKACDGHLIAAGTQGKLRAEVWPDLESSKERDILFDLVGNHGHTAIACESNSSVPLAASSY
jgi:hypothetical protein